MKLSAVVLTQNEEKNIEECLAALAWADEVLVVDSGSEDRTCALAEKHGARLIHHPFENFAAQRNFAASNAKGDWLLFIDADERVTPELADEIKRTISREAPRAVYAIPRKNFFFGKLLRFSDACDDAPVRLFPKAHTSWVQPVHEKIETALPCRKLKSPILHYSTRDFAHHKKKTAAYVPLELVTMREKGVRPGLWSVLVRPLARFFFLYFWKLGILDGIAGFQYAFLSAYYTFEKHWRYWRKA